MSEIDGFKENSLVFILGTTNKIHLVDESLLRSGRFDIKLKIDLPNDEEKYLISKKFLEKVQKIFE